MSTTQTQVEGQKVADTTAASPTDGATNIAASATFNTENTKTTVNISTTVNVSAPLGSIQVVDQKQDVNFEPPAAYLAAPWYLILSDLLIIFNELPSLPFVFLPLNLDQGGLYEDMTFGGMIFQVVAFIVSLVVIVVAGISLFVGIPWPVAAIAGSIVLAQIGYKCQGDESIIKIPKPDDCKRFKHEQWFFINGVATTTSGHKKALTRLQELFQRPIVGINNKSLGGIADLFECLVQRDLRWPTDDIRSGYNVIKKAVLDDKLTRIVITCHSQGGIYASEFADQLLSDFSSKQLKKVEWYTFASAANHFPAPLDCEGNEPWGNVEHFAHSKDMVARFGVLYFSNISQIVRRARPDKKGPDRSGSTSAPASDNPTPPPTATSRFAGRIFKQKASGHMLCSHYLGKHNILDTQAAREKSQLTNYRGGKNPAPAPTSKSGCL